MIDILMEKAHVYFVICKVNEKIAHERFIRRGFYDPRRVYFHGDNGVDMARKGIYTTISPYEEPSFDVPTFYVDTSDGYIPSFKKLKKKLFNELYYGVF